MFVYSGGKEARQRTTYWHPADGGNALKMPPSVVEEVGVAHTGSQRRMRRAHRHIKIRPIVLTPPHSLKWHL